MALDALQVRRRHTLREETHVATALWSMVPGSKASVFDASMQPVETSIVGPGSSRAPVAASKRRKQGTLHVEVAPVRHEENPFSDDMYPLENDDDGPKEDVSHVLRGPTSPVPRPTPRRTHFWSEDGDM